MALQAHIGEYPKNFKFLDNDTDKLTIINSEDFPEKGMLKWLRLNESSLKKGFGNCDGAEATERINVLKFLHENPDITRLIHNVKSAPLTPVDDTGFKDYYSPALDHNPFWQALLALKLALTVKYEELPNRLKIFCDTLHGFRRLEEDEKKMGQIIGKLLSDTAIFEGAGSISVDMREKPYANTSDFELEFFNGHRPFSFSLSDLYQKQYPPWMYKSGLWNLCKWLLLNWNYGVWARYHIDKENVRQRAQAYEMMDIECDRSIKKDIAKAISHMITNEPHIYHILEDASISHQIKFYFSYGRTSKDEGMRLMIYDLEVDGWQDHFSSIPLTKFAGYSVERKRKIEAGNEKLKELISLSMRRTTGSRVKCQLKKVDPCLFFHYHSIKSPETDRTHKWKALDNFYNLPEVREVHKAVSNFRTFVNQHVNVLLEMNELLINVRNKAVELNTTLCFPEILSGEQNIIEFENLYPLHLGQALKDEKIVPINNLPAINGNMIGLTGRHGGGKTVTEHTITGNTYLALSGIPLFGKVFRVNPKTHLGMVFIEGVMGQSVCQLLVSKMDQVFLQIDGVDGKNIVLVLDELGSATQEKDGLALALDVLEEIKRREISLIFSTQILDVARDAEKQFGAYCYKVDKNHKLSPGISGGELKNLVKESGLGKRLKLTRLESLN
ncbi:hypothetical protein K8R32_01595 [bacterium]|nr:hypothetical protein [bacterium]